MVLQVRRRLQGALEELGASRRKVESQASALRTVCREREEEVKIRAFLEVQLSSTECRASALTQELANTRSASGVCECVYWSACVYGLVK